MRIQNRTKWNTDDIRFIVSQCCVMLGYPSHGLRVGIRPSRKRLHWFADPGIFSRTLKKVQGAEFDVTIPNPPKDFKATSEEHADTVLTFTRYVCDALIAAFNGVPCEPDRPIQWLADWYEVRRSLKGQAAGAAASPLLPAPIKPAPTKAELLAVEYAHVSSLYARAVTRRKRAATIERRLAKRKASLERRIAK